MKDLLIGEADGTYYHLALKGLPTYLLKQAGFFETGRKILNYLD
jgi:hypothetical protein